jgi:integrase
MRARNKLTSKSIEHEKEPGRYADGGGLYLQVAKGDDGVTKAWLFRYMINGRARQMGLGPVDDVPLKNAREKALRCRQSLLDGIDPIDERRERRMRVRAEAAKSITFEDCAERYITSHAAGWRNQKHTAQWRATLRNFAHPVVGKMSVAAIDTAHVMHVLEPIWSGKTETASRLRGRIESILDWAKVRGFREGENPARWRGQLEKLLPARSKVQRVKHHAALPYPEISAFMAEVRKWQDGVGARALEFTILTAARTGETIGATWSEFDIGAKVWTVPEHRTKAAREHKVPLCDRAIAIINALPRDPTTDLVFIGDVAGGYLSDMTMFKLLRRMERGDLTVHGFRSTFRDWAAECTNYPNHVLEMALGHALGSKVEAAYRRGDLFPKRQRLMREWERYCTMPAAAGRGNITSIARA